MAGSGRRTSSPADQQWRSVPHVRLRRHARAQALHRGGNGSERLSGAGPVSTVRGLGRQRWQRYSLSDPLFQRVSRYGGVSETTHRWRQRRGRAARKITSDWNARFFSSASGEKEMSSTIKTIL